MAAHGRTSLDDLLDMARAYVRDNLPGRCPRRLKLELDDGDRISHPVPLMAPPQPPAVPARLQPPAPRRHSADYRSVAWDGADHIFTPTQAAVVRLLWEAADNGTPCVGQEKLLEDAGSTAESLREVFREGGVQHPAWGVMLVPGEKRTYRLAGPS